MIDIGGMGFNRPESDFDHFVFFAKFGNFNQNIKMLTFTRRNVRFHMHFTTKFVFKTDASVTNPIAILWR